MDESIALDRDDAEYSSFMLLVKNRQLLSLRCKTFERLQSALQLTDLAYS